MSFTQIKSKSQAERGFTIVELLIVIVVIGILAAITIVSYTGITARANTNTSKGNATTFIKKAELYLNDSTTNRYPLLPTELTAGSESSKSYYLTGLAVTYSATAVTAAPAPNAVRVMKCAATTPGTNTQAGVIAANISGLRVYSFDYTANAEAPAVDVGNTFACPTTN